MAERFEFESFPEHVTHGVAAISYQPSIELPDGFYKERLKAQDQSFRWGFKSTIVGAGAISQSKRLACLNPTNAKFKMKSKNPALVWYLFGFDDSSKINLPILETVDAVSYFDVIPSLARKGVVLYDGKPFILWGDARTSAHPLTGAGLTIPFRLVKVLLNFVDSFDGDEAKLECYNQQTTPLALELFIKTILVTHF